MDRASDRAPDHRLRQLLEVFQPNQEECLEKLNSDDVAQEDLPYPLTRDEAVSFLQNILEMPDPLQLLERDRVKFLNAFIRNMIVKLPFTNLPHVSQPMNEKHCPTFEECKRALFLRHGGHCFYKNTFSKALLDLMGYKTHHVGGNNRGDVQRNTHCGLIVCDLTHPGSLHLAEPGTRRPLYEAIPLDFEEESPTYKFHFMRSKFFTREHGLLLWCTEDPHETESSKYVLESKGIFWKVQLIYRLHVKKTWAFFLEKGTYKCSIPGLMPDTQLSVIHVGHSRDQIVSIFFQRRFEGIGYVAGMKTDSESGPPTELRRLTEKEAIGVILGHFPSYTKQMVQQAFDNVKHSSKLYCIQYMILDVPPPPSSPLKGNQIIA